MQVEKLAEIRYILNFKVVMTFFGKFLEKLSASSTNFQVWSLGLKTQT